MDRNALTELLEALESRRDAEERRREERYTALIERLFCFVEAVYGTDRHVKASDVEDLITETLRFAPHTGGKERQRCGSVVQQFLLHLWIVGRHGYMHRSPRVVVGLFQVRSRQEPPMQQREVLHGYCTGGGVARTRSN
ncbi:UNVERIFIED_CONTAM: hypothetical protein FKN15_073138 [Acipenser sinensis]